MSNLDYKKLRNELRKKASETAKLQKKCRKCKINLSLICLIDSSNSSSAET